MSRRFGNDRSHQDKARAHYLALHGPQARRETAKERDEARAQRSDQDQLQLIARRQTTGVDRGQSAREVVRLKARIDERIRKASEPKVEPTAKQSKQQKGGRQNQR